MDPEQKRARLVVAREALRVLLVVLAAAAIVLHFGAASSRGAPSEASQARDHQRPEHLLANDPRVEFAVSVALLIQVVLGVGVAVILLAARLGGHHLLPQACLVPGRCTLWDVTTVVAFAVVVGKAISWARTGTLLPQHPLVITLTDLYVVVWIETAAVGFAVAIVRLRHGAWTWPLGLTSTNLAVNLLRGAVAYVVVYPACGIALYAVRVLAKRYGWDMAPNPAIQVALDLQGWRPVALLVVLVALVVPILEEIAFRGLLYGAVRRFLPAWPAILVTSLPFALLHPKVHILPIFILGIAAAYLRERTGSLVGCITLHCALNTMTVALFLVMRSVAGGIVPH